MKSFYGKHFLCRLEREKKQKDGMNCQRDRYPGMACLQMESASIFMIGKMY